MREPVFDTRDRAGWDEHDWERFFRRAEVRTARYQELYETLQHHPERDQLIAREMGWEEALKDCVGTKRSCSGCERRFECEPYEMLRLASESESIEDDPDAEELIACFEQVREIPAYRRTEAFISILEDKLRDGAPQKAADEDVRSALLSAQMVSAQIAGGHGIGYERDSLCGNIANCKRALGSLSACVEGVGALESSGIVSAADARELRGEAEEVSAEISRWIESLRARIWWR